MRRNNGTGWACLAILLLAGTAAAQANEKVEVKTVKYAQLGEAVKAQRGKVVVLDVWADW
jgi:thiol:disulfide interchange protein